MEIGKFRLILIFSEFDFVIWTGNQQNADKDKENNRQQIGLSKIDRDGREKPVNTTVYSVWKVNADKNEDSGDGCGNKHDRTVFCRIAHLKGPPFGENDRFLKDFH